MIKSGSQRPRRPRSPPSAPGSFSNDPRVKDVSGLRGNRDFVLLQAGQALSALGSEMSSIAYPLLALSLTHSAAKAGVVGFARIVPYTLLVVPAGVVVDRLNRKAVMIVADAVRAAALASIVVAFYTGHLTFTQVVVVALVEGSGLAFFNLAELGALRAVVPRAQLPTAAAVDQGRLASVVLGGPPLGGVLFGLGRAFPFLADAISYSFSLATLAAMRTPFQDERPVRVSNFRTEIREGFAWLWRHKFLRTCALLFAASNFAWNALILALVVIARREGLSPDRIGLLMAAFGGVALIGSVASPRIQKRLSIRTILVLSFWAGSFIGLFVAKPSVYVLIAGMLPLAVLAPSMNAVVVGYRIAIVPDNLQGRVNSVARLLAQLGSPLGPLVAGLLLQSFSGRLTIGLIAAWFVLLGVWITASRPIRAAPTLDDLASD
jgi:MFS family permease